jgi:hypothetical protein
MTFTDAQRTEARTAVAAALARYPTLRPNGLDASDRSSLDRHAEEVATAIAYLRCCRPKQTPDINSYWLKHRAEGWGKGHGLAPYVCNGALIAAAVYLGFPLRRRNLNALVAVQVRSLPAASAPRWAAREEGR